MLYFTSFQVIEVLRWFLNINGLAGEGTELPASTIQLIVSPVA